MPKITSVEPQKKNLRRFNVYLDGEFAFGADEDLVVNRRLVIGKIITPEDMEKIFHYFPILKERLKQLGGTLSGGEQQMLAIARALMACPKMLLLDEPSLGLAPMMVEKIFEIIKRINQTGVTILLVEQNATAALRLSNKGTVLETGRIVMHGDAKALLKDPQLKAAYFGKA